MRRQIGQQTFGTESLLTIAAMSERSLASGFCRIISRQTSIFMSIASCCPSTMIRSQHCAIATSSVLRIGHRLRFVTLSLDTPCRYILLRIGHRLRFVTLRCTKLGSSLLLRIGHRLRFVTLCIGADSVACRLRIGHRLRFVTLE